VLPALQVPLTFFAFRLYKTVRTFGIPNDPTIACDHARDIIRFEEQFGPFFELGWQRWALDCAVNIFITLSRYA
jgi:hypothetical protein